VDVDLEQRERAIGDVADAYRAARELIEDDRAAEALPLIEMAAERAPVNATIQETYAIALEKVGREVEAAGLLMLPGELERCLEVHAPASAAHQRRHMSR